MENHFDIAVIGGGPAGYVAAIRAAQLGFNTALIEKDTLGGVCLNWGCIPTKALLKSAEVIDLMKNHSKDFGVSIERMSFDFKAIIKRSRDISQRISKNVELLIKKNKVQHIKGTAVLAGEKHISITGSDDKKKSDITADHIILATGARTKELPNIPIDRKHIITSSEAMNLSGLPKDLIIIGAGAIGIEFAYFYNALGVKVTTIELLDHLLPIEDEEISVALEKTFKKRGIEFYTSAKVKAAVVKNGKVSVTYTQDDKEFVIAAEKVLAAVGVCANIENIGLENLGVEVERGFIKVNNSNYATNVPPIYAVGDVIGPPLLAHVASSEAIHCVEAIKGIINSPIDYENIPGCTYCQPQVASVGLTEQQALDQGLKIKVGRFPFMASGKAFAVGERDGFVKLIFDYEHNDLLGAHIIGVNATELIAELCLARSHGATAHSIIKTIHAHPTMSESIMEAAAAALGEAIHI